MNAIILAAGLGSRFERITETTHKALLPINGIPNIERTICYLKEAGIDEIYIVVGYLKEQFDYLVEKYHVTLLENPQYQTYNSIYSFYQALDYFEDSFVIDCDVVLFENIFHRKHQGSKYYVITRPQSDDKEWVVETDASGIIRHVNVCNAVMPSFLGISFWNRKDSQTIKNAYSTFLNQEMLSNPKLYWDNIPISLLDKLTVEPILLSLKHGYEMDNLPQYQFIQQLLNKEW